MQWSMIVSETGSTNVKKKQERRGFDEGLLRNAVNELIRWGQNVQRKRLPLAGLR